MATHKLCLRLNDDDPRQKALWEKIKNSGTATQTFLFEAAWVYKGEPSNIITDEDIERIARCVMKHLEKTGYISCADSVVAEAGQKEDTFDDVADTEDEENVPYEAMDFLARL